MSDMTATQFFRHVADILQTAQERPHGPKSPPAEAKIAGDACIVLCDGDQNRARTLWKLIAGDLGGYMPQAAAVALIRAAHTENLVPDVEAPMPT